MLRVLCVAGLRVLMWTLPARHRRRFHGEMLRTFDRRYRDIGRRGRADLLRLVARTYVDVLRTAVALRLESPRPGSRRNAIPTPSGLAMSDSLLQDIRYAGRGFRSRPGFTVAAVLTLALGIGASTGVFSLLNALLYRTLPGVEDPGRLVALHTGDGDSWGVSSYADFRDFEQRVESFAAAAAHKRVSMDLTTDEGTQRLDGLMVTGEYFAALGVEAALGRLLEPRDDVEPGGHPVVVLSWDTWRSRFGGDPDVLGQQMLLNGAAFTIVGVTPEGFQGTSLGPSRPRLFAPMMMQPHFMPASGNLLDDRGWGGIHVIARLADGSTPARARAGVEQVGAWLRETYPRLAGHREYTVVPLERAALGPSIRQPVARMGALLSAVSGLVLLVACVNVANLLLARAAARRREIALRQALGAGRGRIARQLLVETVLLSLLGGGAGLFLANLVLESFELLPLALPDGIALDSRVLLFTLGVSLTAGVLFGAVPALRATRSDVSGRLSDSRSTRPDVRRRGAGALVSAQVALSMLLLVVAGLLFRTLMELRSVQPGFDPEGVAIMSVDPPLQGYDRGSTAAFYRQLTTRARALPTVEGATLASTLPDPNAGDRIGVFAEGAPDGNPTVLGFTIVGTDYFRVLRMPMLRGRGFEPADADSSSRVVVVNRAAAEVLQRRFGGDVLGRGLSPDGPDGAMARIVGVVGDARSRGLRATPPPMLYLLHSQVVEAGLGARMTLLARTDGDPAALASDLRDLLADIDPAVPAVGVGTLSGHLADTLGQDRNIAIAVGVAAALSLFLALVGLYGLLSYAVTRRTGELGVRMALGADAGDVRRLVVRQGVRLALIGVVVGGLTALATSRLLGAFLFGISGTDPITYGSTALCLLATAAAAAWLPALRATRVDPATALRAD